MASFSADGFMSLMLSMEEVSQIPDAVIDEMLMAEGEIVRDYQKREIVSQGLVDKGLLMESIRVFKKNGKKGRYVLVYPYGNHGSYTRSLKVKDYKRSKHGRTYTVGGDKKEVTNNDVGFIMEFGAPKRGIKAHQWMRAANEKAEPEAVDAAARIYDQFLKSKNL